MATLNITRSYQDGYVLFQDDLDALADSVETFLNTTKITDDNIQDNGITASTKLVDVSVSTEKLAASSVTTSKILDANVTTAKIADANVTTVKIADANVTTAKIADANVTTAKIADGAITPAKRAALGQQISASSGSFSTSTGSYVDVTNLSVSITTTGRPVFICLIGDGNGALLSVIGVETPTTVTNMSAQFKISRDSTNIYETFLKMQSASSSDPILFAPPGAIMTIDIPAAGTYTYKLSAKGANTAYCQYCKLVAFEL
jgi:hypothetical protein